MIKQVTEGRIGWFRDLKPTDIPQGLPNGVRIHLRSNELGIEVQGLVGAVPLLNGDTLQIIPKIGHVNFLRLLFRAEGLPQHLSADFAEYSSVDEETIDSVVARQLFMSAAEILRRSPLQGRILRQKNGSFAAGQLDPINTALNIASRRSEPVSFLKEERTLNLPENRVVSEALRRAWQYLNTSDRTLFESTYHKWEKKFARASNLQSDLMIVAKKLSKGVYGGSRSYYSRTLVLSQVLLGINGIGFGEQASFHGDSVLLNSADIFEKYIFNIVSESYSERGYIVSKGGSSFTSLYSDGSFELKPDIVFSKSSNVLLICDAKYKVPTSADHYQLNTYLATFGVSRGILIAPLFVGNYPVIREYQNRDRAVVREIYLPMSNLSVTEEFLNDILERFG